MSVVVPFTAVITSPTRNTAAAGECAWIIPTRASSCGNRRYGERQEEKTKAPIRFIAAPAQSTIAR